jgi:hypothetical protein
MDVKKNVAGNHAEMVNSIQSGIMFEDYWSIIPVNQEKPARKFLQSRFSAICRIKFSVPGICTLMIL